MNEEEDNMQNLEGCVRLYKRIRRNRIWRREPLTYGQAFLDLILLAVDAQSAPQVLWSRGEQITLQRGQVGWSVLRLAEEWKRSREWVTHFLKYCQNEGMISVDSDRRGTVITITNYDAYQATDLATDQSTAPTTDLATDQSHKGKGETGKGKGVKGNGKEVTPPGDEAAGSCPEIPDDETMAKWFAGFKDLARGVDGIPEGWWRGWVSSRLDAKRWPADWQAAARMSFLGDFASHHPKAMAKCGENKKNGPPSPGYGAASRPTSPDGRTPAQARFELSRELEGIKERLDAAYEIGAEPNAGDLKREKEIEKELKGLAAN